MLQGPLKALKSGYSMMVPPVIRPIMSPLYSVNHIAPSGPAAMPRGPLFAVGMGNSFPLTRA
jgi:hypothetical protein